MTSIDRFDEIGCALKDQHVAFRRHLVDNGFVSAAEMERALSQAKDASVSLHTALRQLSVIDPRALAKATSSAFELPLVASHEWPRSSDIVSRLSVQFLRENKILPLAVVGRHLRVAVSDPTHVKAIDSIRLALGYPVQLLVAGADEIEAAIDRLQATPVEADTIVPADSAGARSDDVAQLKDLALGAPVVRVVNQLLVDAMQLRATDVHIEPGRSRLVIRYRIDGIMREMRSPPADMARAIVSRLKLLAGLDIAERRLPQDGRSRLRIDGREIDLRVATVPTINGEAMAIRLLENARHSLDLDQLGFGAPDIDVLRRHLAAPHGLMLVTGPTGSGKTTTLATALTILNEPTRKILTVEDPIEYQIEGINQIQVKPEIGVTFAHILRSFLRHDPDVIMVGELRDTETSRIAVQAALTGHLVLSTLHTNSAAGAVSRLLDMGIDAYLLASCLRFVIGQRLVRRLCPSCRREVEAPLDMPADVVRQAGQEPGQPVRHYRHHGCDRCHATGYSGRIGIIELLNIDESMSRLIRPDISLPQLTAAALERGMRTMAADGIAKCLAGVTTLEEVRRVALEA